MNQVDCLYCGAPIPADQSRCPRCGSPSHFQQQGYRSGGRLRLALYFILFALLVLAAAFWLPR